METDPPEPAEHAEQAGPVQQPTQAQLQAAPQAEQPQAEQAQLLSVPHSQPSADHQAAVHSGQDMLGLLLQQRLQQQPAKLPFKRK